MESQNMEQIKIFEGRNNSTIIMEDFNTLLLAMGRNKGSVKKQNYKARK